MAFLTSLGLPLGLMTPLSMSDRHQTCSGGARGLMASFKLKTKSRNLVIDPKMPIYLLRYRSKNFNPLNDKIQSVL